MADEKKSKGCLIAALIWILIISAVAASYRYIIAPWLSGYKASVTGSESQYDHVVTVRLDSFSGYCILRSQALQNSLKTQRIRLELDDDGGDYLDRLKALQAGKAQMAVFTIDSYIAAGADTGDYPGAIVLTLDETRGADAIVAYKESVARIQDLDDPNARFVITPNSPSEFLARIVLAQFSLPSLPEKWADELEGAEKVYNRLRTASPKEKRAYVLWEPYVTRALDIPGAHILMDSSHLQGYIVDVLVAERTFLRENPAVVRAVVESYLRAAYSYGNREGAMAELVLEDAKRQGDSLTQAQAERLVAGIHWKNTLENYTHFGLTPPDQTPGIQHIEDMISTISDVLVRTGRLLNDPVAGRANTLFYDRVLRDMQAANFHPAIKGAALPGVTIEAGALDAADTQAPLPALSEAQWQALVPVGEARVEPIAFARGAARLNLQSERDLEALAKRLNSMPRYYVLVTGHARAEGDAEANRKLAQERADVAAQKLKDSGVQPTRVKAIIAPPSRTNGGAQSVSFVVGHPPY